MSKNTILLALLLACREAQPDVATSSTDTSARERGADTLQHPVASRAAFPRVGLAVLHENQWCAELPADSARNAPTPGQHVTLVFADSAAAEIPASMGAVILAGRSAQCHTEFGQPRWFDYIAYDLKVVGKVEVRTLGDVAVIVLGESTWQRGQNGRVRADLDGDGTPEEAMACAADEGVHYLIESVPPNGRRIRRVHEYFDWGAIVERTCPPDVDGA